MNDQLAAVIVHDLKNALGVLEGELSRLTTDPTRERAVVAHQTCISLRDKLIGFLTLYKASSQGLAPRIEAVSIEDFLHALIREIAIDRPEVTVSVAAGDLLVLGFFDEHLVRLALDAALHNAMRFARTFIEIGCMREKTGELLFAICDDGPGVDATEQIQSTGLGMELCAAIAQAHRNGGMTGSIALRSGAKGGAVFELRLP